MQLLALPLTCLLLAAAPPKPADATARVHDFAQVMSAAQRRQLDVLAQAVERDTTAQLAIVTVRSLDGKSIEEYANELFKSWGIGRQDFNNGVLLLVAPSEHRVRIEVGYGLEPLLTDSLCGEIRDHEILPHFRNGDLPGGIRLGAERIVQILRDHPEAARGVKGSAPVWVRTKRRDALTALAVAAGFGVVLAFAVRAAGKHRNYSSVWFFLTTTAAAAVGGGAAFLVWKAPQGWGLWGWTSGAGAWLASTFGMNVSRYRRYGPNHCRRCGTRLELLDEAADDEKLTEVQRLEEQLGSIDYDVWYCPACLHSVTEQYINWASDLRPCPSCKVRAYRESAPETIQPATTFSSGTARVVGTCMSCKKRTDRIVVLPKIATTSSSSGGSGFSSSGGGGGGGSFGGGSSGGGGASGSW